MKNSLDFYMTYADKLWGDGFILPRFQRVLAYLHHSLSRDETTYFQEFEFLEPPHYANGAIQANWATHHRGRLEKCHQGFFCVGVFFPVLPAGVVAGLGAGVFAPASQLQYRNVLA